MYYIVRRVGMRPLAMTSLWGREAYPTLDEKAAVLLESLVRNRALVDGNKRLGWLATVVFLDINGRRPTTSTTRALRRALRRTSVPTGSWNFWSGEPASSPLILDLPAAQQRVESEISIGQVQLTLTMAHQFRR